MNPKLLFRKSLAEEDEIEVARQYFDVVEHRSNISRNNYVIGRYSVLPYYRELEQDIKNVQGHLVNSYGQYSYISKISNWYPDFEGLTFKTWFNLVDVPKNHPGAFVLKGNINSRKQLWKTHMFAENRNEVINVYNRLLDDTLLSHQDIVIREYEPLMSYGDNIVGMPVTNEFRVFIYKKQVVSMGYYWSSAVDDFDINTDTSQVPQDLIDKAIDIVGDKCNFWTLDVGQKENGEWTIIEMGDAQMAGLSMNDPYLFYGNLANIVKKEINNQ